MSVFASSLFTGKQPTIGYGETKNGEEESRSSVCKVVAFEMQRLGKTHDIAILVRRSVANPQSQRVRLTLSRILSKKFMT